MHKFNVGERVYIKSVYYVGNGTVAEVSKTIIGAYSYVVNTDGFNASQRPDGTAYVSEDELEKIEETETVDRDARIGEKIKITRAVPQGSQKYKEGDIFTVTKAGVIFPGDVKVEGQPLFIDRAEYEVVVVDSPEMYTGIEPLVFVQHEEGNKFTVYQDGKEVEGIRSIRIDAGVEDFTTHEIEFLTGKTKGGE